MNTSLKGKRAVVCGSTQGIGLAIARELASMGATCVLLARNEDALGKVVAELPVPESQEHGCQVADFDEPAQVQKAIGQIVESRPVHILINNSGGPKAGQVLDANPDEFMLAMKRHLVCNQILVQAVVPSMKAEKYGRIINIISYSVRTPIENLGVSNTTRAAVAAWSKSMSNELGAFQITVNSVLPGNTNTARLQSLIENNARRKGISPEDLSRNMKENIPMKRFGEPEEIAAVAAFLASPAASYVNGISILVDGGSTGTI